MISNEMVWVECGYGSEELILSHIVNMRVRPIRGVKETQTRWVFDCNDITSAPIYATKDDAKQACVSHAKAHLKRALLQLGETNLSE